MPREITIPATVGRYYRDYGSLSFCAASRAKAREKRKERNEKKVHLSVDQDVGSRETGMNYSARSIRLVNRGRDYASYAFSPLDPSLSLSLSADKLDRINEFHGSSRCKPSTIMATRLRLICLAIAENWTRTWICFAETFEKRTRVEGVE